MNIIYLDHAAATPLDERVLAAMTPYFAGEFYNPSSPYAPALSVRRDYEAAKARLAACIGAKADELVMTAGATESINLAFNSVGGHVVTSAVEHEAVLAAARRHEHTIVTVDNLGRVSPLDIEMAIRADTRIVSIGLANSEIGTIQPIAAIARIVHAKRQARLAAGDRTPLVFHCDASQGAGLLDIHVARLGVDMLTLNAGKIYGPKQVGLLWAASNVKLSPSIVGGGQERGLRSGTENVPGVIGFALALELATAHRESENKRLRQLRGMLQQYLCGEFPEAVVSGDPNNRLASHLHISFPGLDGERLVFRLEARGVLVATGSACAANKGTRSHVLTAISLPDDVADGSLRLTLGALTDESVVAQAATIISEEVALEKNRISQ